MSTDRTRNAILTAAETLWAERSFGDVTMRDIVAAAGVNLAAVNYHFGSKDELLAELFVSRSTVLNKERFAELKSVQESGGGRASVAAILHALAAPPLRWCLSPDRQQSAAARFMTRASTETVPPIKKIVDREFRHLQRFADALIEALPNRSEADIYWGLHFTLAMIRQTVTDRERLRKLSGGACDMDDTEAIITRIVVAGNAALADSAADKRVNPAPAVAARRS